jgi:hypothetical protein
MSQTTGHRLPESLAAHSQARFTVENAASGTASSGHLAFERRGSDLTLAQGLAVYHSAISQLAKERSMSSEAQEFFRCHDAVHVVFGCGTSLNDEAVVKIASILGTTAGLSVLKGYRLHESIEVYRRLPVRAILLSIAQSPVLVSRTVVRCLRQSKRWPWNDFDHYLDMPLSQIRREFGIRVGHLGASDKEA